MSDVAHIAPAKQDTSTSTATIAFDQNASAMKKQRRANKGEKWDTEHVLDGCPFFRLCLFAL